VDAYAIAHPDLARPFTQALADELPEGWETHLPTFTPADGEMATRDAGGAVIKALADSVTNHRRGPHPCNVPPPAGSKEECLWRERQPARDRRSLRTSARCVVVNTLSREQG
jgi:hypothetical protein